MAFSVFVIADVQNVPFHPDEATYIYMSQDFDTLFLQGNLRGVAWDARNDAHNPGPDYHRLLNAPLARYAAGLGRLVAGFVDALPVDWDWSLDWSANTDAGALPSPGLLRAARLPAAMLVALAPGLIFLIGQKIDGPGLGVTAAVLYAANGYVHLHGRRAMSEGLLIFFVCLAFYAALRWRTKPIIVGALVAVASAAKLTGLLMLPVSLAATCLPAARTQLDGWRNCLRRAGIVLAAFAFVFVLLSPALWLHPLEGARAMLAARNEVLTSQVAMSRAATPGLVLDNAGVRVLALLYQSLFAPPAFWDVPNYAVNTQAAEAAFVQNPVNSLLPGRALLPPALAGALLATLMFTGMIFSVRSADRRNPGITLLWAWTLATSVGLLVFIHIAWQRYYILMAPIISIWTAYALLQGWSRIRRLRA